MAHRGEIIETYIRNQGISLTKLANKTPFTTRTMYRHFADQNLDLEKILDYSMALKHDFSDEIPEMALYSLHLGEPDFDYTKTKNSHSEDNYRDKYERLLEKYTALQELYLKKMQTEKDHE